MNGSTVEVTDISTAGNGWHGINVDLGSGVTSPAVLTVKGVSSHTELLHIYIDNIAEPATMVDVNSQYTFNDNVLEQGDRLYTLIPQPKTISECKNSGWVAFGFRNQGLCIQYVNTGKDSRN